MNYTSVNSGRSDEHSRVSACVVRDVMDTHFASFSPEMSMEEAVSIIIKNKTTGGPVLGKHGQLVGFLSERDCLRMAMESRYHNFHGGHVESYMRQKVHTVPAKLGLFHVVDLFIDQWFHAYPVEDDGQIVGVITRKKVLRAVNRIKRTTW
jgi:CBS domain-containing protein